MDLARERFYHGSRLDILSPIAAFGGLTNRLMFEKDSTDTPLMQEIKDAVEAFQALRAHDEQAYLEALKPEKMPEIRIVGHGRGSLMRYANARELR